jgi:diguanylate cyclase (GGDEF)-like protein
LAARKIAGASNQAQVVFSFLLFVVAIAVAGPAKGFVLPFPFATAQIAGVITWVGELLACLAVMWRLANSLSNDACLIFTRHLLFSFVLYFWVQRGVNSAILLLAVNQVAHVQPWIRVLSSTIAAGAAALLLPRLHAIRRGYALEAKEHARFLAAAETTLDDFYIFDGIADASGRIVDFRFSYINPNAERRLSVKRENLMGKILTEVRPFMISSGLIEKYRDVVRTGVPFITEVFIDDDMIKATWLNVQVVKLGDGIAITSRDVTDNKRLLDRINYLAHHDQLTGLANRALLQDRLQQALIRANRYCHKVAVFLLDIDHFKRINDSLGHTDGDTLLAVFGQRLLASVRESDTVARIGGDEFVIVMPEFRNLEDVKYSGAKIVEGVSKPIAIGNREITITVSAGVCVYPDCGLELDDLLKNADAAMYMIKDSGRNGLHVFDGGASEESAVRLAH